jgi:PAS domain S-box-containing protein
VIESVSAPGSRMPPPSVPLNAIRQPSFLYGRDGAIADANDLAETLAGQRLVGLSPVDVIRTFRHCRRDGTCLAPAELPACRALAGEEVVDDPFAVTLGDGRTIDILASASAIRDGDAIIGALVIWQDVTQQKQVETDLARYAEDLRESRQELADVIAATGAGYFRLALDRLDGAISPRGAEILGFSTPEMPSLLEILAEAQMRMHPDDMEGVITSFMTFVEADTERSEMEFRVRTPEGGWRWVQAIGTSAERDGAGRVVTLAGFLFDIDARKKAEVALRQSEERLRDVLDLSLDAVYRLDLGTGRFDYISPVNELLTGFSAEEFGAFSLEEFTGRIHPDDRDRLGAIIASAMKGTFATTSGPIEYRFLHRDGSYRWLSDHFTFQTDTDGRPRYRVGVVRDVTRQKEIEAALRESEERLRLAQEAAGIGIWDRDIATDRVTVTSEVIERYGLKAEAMRTYGDWIRFTHPDDRRRLEEARHAAIAAGEPLDLEFRVVTPSGEARWIQLKGRVVPDSHGDPARVIGVIIDITGRKHAEEALAESEAKYRNLVELSPDAILIHLDGMIVFANPAAVALVGSSGMDDLVGRPVLEIVHPRTQQRVEWNIEADLRGEASPLTATDVVRRDGTTVTVQGRGAMIPFGGRPAVQVVLRDVTEQLRAEAERARFTEELQRSNEELQRFAYVASHDLQEPLRSIVSFSQLLERRYGGKLDQDADEFIGFIVEGGNRMQRLIEDLLTFSRVATQARPLAPTDAGEVVADVIHAMETPICEAGATVTVEALPTVKADAAQLAQVFTNLIGNALKYRRPDVPPEVRISAERTGRVWRFSVADNGIGIEAEYFGRIFVIFQRLHTREEFGGTGIGLAIVKRIIDRHGGKVWVESTPGEGTTFFFTLPAA